MAKLKVQRRIEVNSSPEEIFKIIADFHHWESWSPWLIQEPGVRVDIREDGKYYEWKGERVGSGNMTILKQDEYKSIDYDLCFLKPWKSKAKVRFEIEEKPDGCEIIWYMESSLPWFMFWMKKMTEAFIGMDYERGLLMLKDKLEDGKIHSSLDFIGKTEMEEFLFIGIKTATSKAEMPDQMQADFESLFTQLKNEEENNIGEGLSIYHKWDMVKERVEYTAAMKVKQYPENLESNIIKGRIPKTQVYQIKHIGPYHHLGNAWSSMYSLKRAKAFKSVKGIDPFEIYGNRPKEVKGQELLSTLNFPCK
tara:strand:+ start:1641 stop:2564 length:924 start_codon:yes stop_codon:yes gene_type:complete